ncbi:MAG: hypothetical protein GTO02_14360 [Candidatus Dadabacteria bacterium]|nr:hypothetical protein [Candidatus Dadabacteria bacterium]
MATVKDLFLERDVDLPDIEMWAEDRRQEASFEFIENIWNKTSVNLSHKQLDWAQNILSDVVGESDDRSRIY